MTAGTERIADLIRPTIEALDLTLWGVEYMMQGRSALLRIYIDSPDGIGIDDCERASRQISAVLDVEDPISGEYTLEVSSPGMDRPLFELEQYQQYIGSMVQIRLRSPQAGRRNFKGVLEKVEQDIVYLQLEDGIAELPFSAIDKASLVL